MEAIAPKPNKKVRRGAALARPPSSASQHEEEGDTDTVCEHKNDGRWFGDRVGFKAARFDECGISEEDITHVHDRRVAEHGVETLLVEGDVANPQDVAEK